MTLKAPASRNVLLASPVLAAALLAGALVAVSVLAARTLRARDAAVRDGLLARAAHEMEGSLRESGPENAAATLAAVGEAHRDLVRGLAVVSGAGVLASWGALEGTPFQTAARLGPAWRGHAGPGAAMGMGPPGPMGRSPFVLRLHPRPDAGSAGRLPFLLVTGSLAAGIGLFASSLLAARGLAARERLERVEAERQRLDALALAGAGLAHRIRNPLAAIKGTAQLMAEQPQAPVAPRAARVLEATARIEELAGQLLRFARPPDPNAELFDLAALAREAAERAVGRVETIAPAPVGVRADAGHAADVLDELLANARAHDVDGTLEVEAGIAGATGFVEVRDRGAGLSLDAEQAFAPFVTTRPGGTGLGLPTVRALARANGGDVTLAAREGGGCAARLTLPQGAA